MESSNKIINEYIMDNSHDLKKLSKSEMINISGGGEGSHNIGAVIGFVLGVFYKDIFG